LGLVFAEKVKPVIFAGPQLDIGLNEISKNAEG
jgi:hypothetical protein